MNLQRLKCCRGKKKTKLLPDPLGGHSQSAASIFNLLHTFMSSFNTSTDFCPPSRPSCLGILPPHNIHRPSNNNNTDQLNIYRVRHLQLLPPLISFSPLVKPIQSALDLPLLLALIYLPPRKTFRFRLPKRKFPATFSSVRWMFEHGRLRFVWVAQKGKKKNKVCEGRVTTARLRGNRERMQEVATVWNRGHKFCIW